MRRSSRWRRIDSAVASHTAVERVDADEPTSSHRLMTSRTSLVTAASPSRTVVSRPSRGDHNAPVRLMRGRIHAVRESIAAGAPTLRQSETIMCVAPISACANVTGTASLTPPSVRRSGPVPEETGIAGNRCGIDALARTASDSVTCCSQPVPKYRGRPLDRS